jgi:hypothetical protein
MPTFVRWVSQRVKTESKHAYANGIWYLKGGDLAEELAPYKKKVKVYSLHERIPLPFFETKKLVYLPIQPKKG